MISGSQHNEDPDVNGDKPQPCGLLLCFKTKAKTTPENIKDANFEGKNVL